MSYAKYTPDNVYWMTLSGGVGLPQRMAFTDGTPAGGTPATTHSYTHHHELNQTYWSKAPGEDGLDRWVFGAYAYGNWTAPAPQYVLLVGDAIYDFHDRWGTGKVNYVPTYLTFTQYMGETATDEWYAAISGDDALPDLYIGRLPAAINAGALMVNYSGHAAYANWANEHILNSALFEQVFTKDQRELGPAIANAKMTLLANGDAYYYVVRSVDADGIESVDSESVSIVIPVPSASLSGTASKAKKRGRIEFGWGPDRRRKKSRIWRSKCKGFGR